MNDAGIPLAESQGDLTPFQRMVLMLEMKRQQEDAKDGNHGSGGYNGVQNSHPGAGQKMQGETVKYVNDNA